MTTVFQVISKFRATLHVRMTQASSERGRERQQGLIAAAVAQAAESICCKMLHPGEMVRCV